MEGEREGRNEERKEADWRIEREGKKEGGKKEECVSAPVSKERYLGRYVHVLASVHMCINLVTSMHI